MGKIKKLSGLKILSREEQKNINGSEWYCYRTNDGGMNKTHFVAGSTSLMFAWKDAWDGLGWSVYCYPPVA